MKLIASLLSLVMFIQLVCFPLPALAAVSYSGGGAQGQASVNKIGKLLLAEGIATLTATTIEIASKDNSGQQNTQLKGRLFRTAKTGSTIRGLAFFNAGAALSQLDSAGCDEYVKKIDGTRISGPVTNVTENAVTCAGQTIRMGDVSKIHSARVFEYKTKIGETPKLKFSPTCAKMKAGGKRLTTKRKIIIAAVAVAIVVGVACGIAIPLAVGGGRRSSPPPFIAPAAPAPVSTAPAPMAP